MNLISQFEHELDISDGFELLQMYKTSSFCTECYHQWFQKTISKHNRRLFIAWPFQNQIEKPVQEDTKKEEEGKDTDIKEEHLIGKLLQYGGGHKIPRGTGYSRVLLCFG